jgi:hypothetical protein
MRKIVNPGLLAVPKEGLQNNLNRDSVTYFSSSNTFAKRG